MIKVQSGSFYYKVFYRNTLLRYETQVSGWTGFREVVNCITRTGVSLFLDVIRSCCNRLNSQFQLDLTLV